MASSPVDLRTDAQRAQAARGTTADFERAAAVVVARFTGERVTLHDDNRTPRTPDIRVDYTDGKIAVIEVVVDVDPKYAEAYAGIFLRGSNIHPAPSLTQRWVLRLASHAKLKRLRHEQERLLALLSDADNPFGDPRYLSGWTGSADPADQELKELGVVGLHCSALSAGETGEIVWRPMGIGGPTETDWPGFLRWIADFLASPETADVRRNLGEAPVDCRHVFVGASATSPWAAWNARRPGVGTSQRTHQHFRPKSPISGSGPNPRSVVA